MLGTQYNGKSETCYYAVFYKIAEFESDINLNPTQGCTVMAEIAQIQVARFLQNYSLAFKKIITFTLAH